MIGYLSAPGSTGRRSTSPQSQMEREFERQRATGGGAAAQEQGNGRSASETGTTDMSNKYPLEVTPSSPAAALHRRGDRAGARSPDGARVTLMGRRID